MIVESYEDVIVLSGALRQNFWDTVETAITLTLRRHPAGVIVDGSGITEITVEGAQTFASFIEFVREHDRARVIFAALPDHVETMLRSVPEVRSQLAITRTVEEARTSLDLLCTSPEPAAKKKLKSQVERRVLVVFCPDSFDRHLLDVAVEFSDARDTRLVLLLPIVVPRDLPIHAAMPEQESRAASLAESAQTILDDEQLTYEIRLERTRDLPSLVRDMGEETQSDHVLVGLSPHAQEDDVSVRQMRLMMDKVKRSLLFVCSGGAAEETP